MTDVKNTSTTGGDINSGRGLSSTDFLNNSLDLGGYAMPPGILRAVYRNTNIVTPKVENAATSTKAPAKTVEPPKNLIQPAILAKLTPAVLQQPNLDKVVDSKTLNSIRLRTPAQKATPTTQVEIKPVKVTSEVLDKIEAKTDIGLAPSPSKPRIEETEKAKTEPEETKTKSTAEIDKKYDFSDQTLEAISGSIPGALATTATPKVGPGIVGETKSPENEEILGETETKKRRRVRLKVSSSPGTSVRANRLGGFGVGASSSSGSSQGRRPSLRFGSFASPTTGQFITPSEPGLSSGTGVTPQTTEESREESTQQSPQQNLQDNIQNAQNRLDQAKQAYERVERFLPKQYQGLTSQGGSAAADTAASEAGGLTNAAGGVAETSAVQAGTTSVGATGTGAAGAGAVEGVGAGAGAGSGLAIGGISLGAIGVAILAVIVVILVGVLIYVVSTIAATENTTRDRNTAGNAKAFFERAGPNAGSAIGSTNEALNPNFTKDTAPFLLDATGKVLEIRIGYFYQLNALDKYNTLFLGPNSKNTIAVTDIAFKSRMNLPPNYKDANGNIIDTAPQSGYALDTIAPNTQPYPSDFSVASTDNTISWKPAICDSLSTKLGGLFSSSNETVCRSQYLEKFAIILKFVKPVDPAAFNNRLIVSLEGNITINYYDKASGKLLGPGTVPIEPIYVCMDPQNINTTDCANPNNAQNANGSVNTGTYNPGEGSGTVIPGCPIAINPGEKLVCTSGFDPNRVLIVNGQSVSSPHYANDFVVQNSFGQSQADRSVVSPVNGKIVAVSSDSYTILAGVWIKIQDSDNPNLTVMIAHIQPGTRTFTVGDILKKGDILGVPKSTGAFNQYWQGMHTHFETIYAPRAVGSDPRDYLRTGCNQPNYSCN